MFDEDCLGSFFDETKYSSVLVANSLTGASIALDHATHNVLIVANNRKPPNHWSNNTIDSEPGDGDVYFDGIRYEARSVVCFKGHRNRFGFIDSSKFHMVRLNRHGNKIRKWWHQTTSPSNNHPVMLKLRTPNGIHLLPDDFEKYITVYVKAQNPFDLPNYKLNFFRSIGGETHVICDCNQFPLIVSGRSQKNKMKCMKVGCTKKEYYCCSSIFCMTRLCKDCYNEHDKATITCIQAPAERRPIIDLGQDDNQEVQEGDADEETNQAFFDAVSDENEHDVFYDSADNDNYNSDSFRARLDVLQHDKVTTVEAIRSAIRERDGENGNIMDIHDLDRDDPLHNELFHALLDLSQDDEEMMKDYLTQSPFDNNDDDTSTVNDYDEEEAENENLENDNALNEDQMMPGNVMDDGPAMPTTDSGNIPLQILKRISSVCTVPCHVLLNQVGRLYSRRNHNIHGTRLQKNFIQRIVSTTLGRSMPLLYLLGACFPRHFYAEASNDPDSIL